MPFQSFKASEYLQRAREYDFLLYVSRTTNDLKYLGLIERESLAINTESVRSLDEESGGELLYYKTTITCNALQLNPTTLKGIVNLEDLNKGKWFVYLQCLQDSAIAFGTPFPVGIRSKTLTRYNEYHTELEVSFLTDSLEWLKGNRFEDPVFVTPSRNAQNVSINTQIVLDVERDVLFNLELRLDATNDLVISFVRVFSTNGFVDGSANSNVSVGISPDNPNFNRLAFTIPALTQATTYKIVFEGQRFGYQRAVFSQFVTLLSAPIFETPPTPMDSETYALLEGITIQTLRTNLVSQEALITIKNTSNPSNPFVVLNSAKIYNEATQLSLQQGFTPTEYGRYTIEVRDRANGVLSSAITRNVIYVDRYEELASRTNVLFAWNSLKAVQSSGIATSLQLDGQGLLGVKPNLNLPSSPSNRPLVVTDSSHRGYPVLFAQGRSQRHLYADTTLFTGGQLAVFLFKKTDSSDQTLFGASIPSVADWRMRTFIGDFVGQSYFTPSTGERFDNFFNGEMHYRDTSGNIVSSNTTYHPINQWVLVAIRYNIPISVANFALFGYGNIPNSTNPYLSIGFILNSSNWSDRTDFVDYLMLFL
jgi:hypothetical protein